MCPSTQAQTWESRGSSDPSSVHSVGFGPTPPAFSYGRTSFCASCRWLRRLGSAAGLAPASRSITDRAVATRVAPTTTPNKRETRSARPQDLHLHLWVLSLHPLRRDSHHAASTPEHASGQSWSCTRVRALGGWKRRGNHPLQLGTLSCPGAGPRGTGERVTREQTWLGYRVSNG